MTELKLGNKYECFNCGAKFYDLAKGSSICPKCGADQDEAEAKENPLVSQSVRRRRRTELLPDDAETGSAEDAEDADDVVLADDDLDDEDVELEAELEAELEDADLEEEEEEEDDDL
jgi:uncharacterized protein (TIGR02300 family)